MSNRAREGFVGGGLRKPLAVLLIVAMLAPTFAAAAPPGQPQDQQARLKRLVAVLGSLSNESCEKVLADLPSGSSRDPRLASRGAVLSSAYKSLAALEYRQAGATEDLRRVDRESLHEAGWAGDLFHWADQAAPRDALYGGFVVVGRPTGLETATLEKELAEATEKEKPALHRRLGAAYEALASASLSESEGQRAAKERERLTRLADFLRSVSDEDYQKALKQAPTGERPAPRGEVLKNSYAALAALEYKEAGLKPSPRLQEAGLGTLGLAVLGIGYAIYEKQRRKKVAPPAPRPEDSKRTALRARLAHADLDAEQRAQAHRELGAAYEDMAFAEGSPAAEESEAGGDPIKADTTNMDAMGREMQEQIERKRP